MIFNFSQRAGIACLLLLACAVIVIPRHFLPSNPQLTVLPEPVQVRDDSLLIAGPDSTVRSIPRKRSGRKRVPAKPLELNRADSASLVQLPGIGPYYASRIIRYRDRLGGFHAVTQLKEIRMTYFNVDSSLHFFRADPSLITKKDLDTMSFKAILRHPYLEYEDVRMIFQARRRYGGASMEILERHGILPAYKLKKIKPYFK